MWKNDIFHPKIESVHFSLFREYLTTEHEDYRNLKYFFWLIYEINANTLDCLNEMKVTKKIALLDSEAASRKKHNKIHILLNFVDKILVIHEFGQFRIDTDTVA